MTNAVVVSKKLQFPEKVGTHKRLLCLSGPQKGTSYFLGNERTVVGRSESVGISLLDSKMSREHAEIIPVGGHYVITDLGSQNGIIVNDLKVLQHDLKNGDKIVIGQTVFKYEIKTILESDLIKGKENTQEKAGGKNIKEVPPPEKENNKGKSKRTLLLVLIGLLAFLFLSEDTVQAPKKATPIRTSDVTSEFVQTYKAQLDEKDKEIKDKLSSIIQKGLREFRERNFFRAIQEFELALMVSPNNARATFYLNKSKQGLDEEIDSNFLRAERDVQSLKYKSAQVGYCAIIKLLEEFPTDDRFKRAKNEIGFLEKKMGLESGEINCI